MIMERNKSYLNILGKERQEAHGPRLTHSSEIARADMQMLCNIVPILLLQLMRGSTFESIEGDHLNKLSIPLQQ